MEKNMDMEKDTDMEKDVEKKNFRQLSTSEFFALLFAGIFVVAILTNFIEKFFKNFSSSYSSYSSFYNSSVASENLTTPNSSVASEKHTSSNSFYNSSFSSVYKDCIARCGENYKKDRGRCLLYYAEGVDLITKGKPSYYNIDMVVMATEDCLMQAEIKLLDCHRNCRSGF